MTITGQCEHFDSRYDKLNEFGKQYIMAVLQSLEFAQDTATHLAAAQSGQLPRNPPSRPPHVAHADVHK